MVRVMCCSPCTERFNRRGLLQKYRLELKTSSRTSEYQKMRLDRSWSVVVHGRSSRRADWINPGFLAFLLSLPTHQHHFSASLIIRWINSIIPRCTATLYEPRSVLSEDSQEKNRHIFNLLFEHARGFFRSTLYEAQDNLHERRRSSNYTVLLTCL